MENKSNGGSKFTKVNTPENKDKENNNNNTESNEVQNSAKDVIDNVVNDEDLQKFVDSEKDLESSYTHISSITISLVQNHSLFRKINDKVLPAKIDYIGSSINSSKVLSSNKDEVETYFPALIGLASNNPEFVSRVKQYLNNIRIPVDALGRKFNTSFIYRKKKDYIDIANKEELINRKYNSAKKNDIKSLRAALKVKLDELNALESTRYTYGSPVNIDDYLMYRHCLLYKDIAKDPELVRFDSSIRFYFKDDVKEEERAKKYRLEINKAKINYVKCLSDDQLFDAVYVQYCINKSLPVINSLAEDKLDREVKLDSYSSNEPIKFNEICNDSNIKLKAEIEKLIARGELIRLDYNQNITTTDGTLIGSNIGEAVVWFKDVSNTSEVNSFRNRLNNI